LLLPQLFMYGDAKKKVHGLEMWRKKVETGMRFLSALVLLCGLFLSSALGACSVERPVMVSILMNESHPKRELGYEFLISFNSSQDAALARQHYNEFFIDSRSLDCKTKELCSEITYILVSAGISNIDIGPYQLNYRFQVLEKLGDYFDFIKSYNHACSYVEKMIARYGYGWWAIASYHSQTKKHNYKYQENLIKNYLKIASNEKSR